MDTPTLEAPRLILIGATGREQGKTTLAAALIAHFRGRAPIFALKVTTVHMGSTCPRGGQGCGACAAFPGGYELLQETSSDGAKDTSRLLAAGANAVFWLRAEREHLLRGFQAFLMRLPPDAFILCESNSLREYVKPGFFIMLAGDNAKPSASRARPYADMILGGNIFVHFDELVQLLESHGFGKISAAPE